jgi:hypothetical protein
MAGSLGALGHDDVHARGDLLAGLVHIADQRRHRHALVVRLRHDIFRRRPQRVRQQLDRVGKRHVHQRAGRGIRPAQELPGGLLTFGQGRHAVFREHVVDELPVPFRDGLGDLFDQHVRIEDARAFERGRHDHVHPIGCAVDLLIDPRQFPLQLVGREPQGAQHAEPAGLADLGHHRRMHAEREDRVVDAEPLGQRGGNGHAFSLAATATDLAHG